MIDEFLAGIPMAANADVMAQMAATREAEEAAPMPQPPALPSKFPVVIKRESFFLKATRWVAGELSRGLRFDEAMIFGVMRLAFNVYRKTTGFVWAHRKLWAGQVEARRRREACIACNQRGRLVFGRKFVAADGPMKKNDFCFGTHQGSGCGCPKSCAWPPGQLRYKIKLKTTDCPLKRWD